MFGTISYNATGPSCKKKILTTVECLSGKGRGEWSLMLKALIGEDEWSMVGGSQLTNNGCWQMFTPLSSSISGEGNKKWHFY